jgi:predicted porin
MQKKLLGLAVAGALAAPGLALAQVEVYGFINMSVGNFKYSGATDSAVGSVSKWDVASHASNYGIRGRENIGMGQTAWFQIEQNAPMARSNDVSITPASRNSAVGVQGNWGNAFIGQWTTPWADLDALWGIGTVGGWGPITSIIGRRETTGTAPSFNCANGHTSPAAGVCNDVEAAGGVGHPFWRRASNSIFYQSPVFAGVQVKLMYQTNESKATANTTGSTATTIADPSMWSGSVQWAGLGGRVRVGAAMDAHKDFTTAGQTDNGWRVTGGWNFGFMDVGLAYEQMTYKIVGAECEATQYGIQLAIPIGQGAIRAAYAIAKDFEGGPFETSATGAITGAATGAPAFCGAATVANGGAAAAADNGAKTWNIGYDYRFSKRTTIGFGYAIIQNDAGSQLTWTGAPPPQTGGASGGPLGSVAPLPGSDPSTFFVNMVHRF